MTHVLQRITTLCASLVVFSCKERPYPPVSQNQQIVGYGWSQVKAAESQSGLRELILRLEAVNPSTELELRFEFPEPKNLEAVHATQEQTILVLDVRDAEYRFDHRALLEQADHYQKAGLLSLRPFKNIKGESDPGE